MVTITTNVTVNDIPRLKQLYKETVLSVNRKDYTAEEVEDWASCGDSDERWLELISTLHFFIAENEKGQIAGFASLSDNGLLHSLFVHKDAQRKGVASQLYRKVEEHAKQQHIKQVYSEVSKTARPFFEAQGFTVEEEQQRKANKLYLTNYKMSKTL